MKLLNLVVIGFFCLFLGGCTTTGGGGPVPPVPAVPPVKLPSVQSPKIARKEDDYDIPEGQRQTVTQRECAAEGRLTYPADNASCLRSETGGACCDYPVWITVAMSYLGYYEGSAQCSGKKGYNNIGESLAVLEFHERAKYTGIMKANKYKVYTGAAAWCGSFVNWCLTEATNPKTGKNYSGFVPAFRARSWAHGDQNGYNSPPYGDEVSISDPFVGAIIIIQSLSYPETSYSGHHVAFIVGKRNVKLSKSNYDKFSKYYNAKNIKAGAEVTEYLCLGGNQDDSVTLAYYGQRHRVVGIRKPKDFNPCKEHYNLTDTWWVKYANSCSLKENSGKTT